MRKNKIVLFVHFVWATWDRAPLIQPYIERPLYRCIHSEAEKQSCDVLALNGVADHVHLLLKMPSTVDLATVMKQVKGASSDELFANRRFKWQGGYGAFSVSRWDVDLIRGYICKQKRHHAEQAVRPELEEIYEEC